MKKIHFLRSFFLLVLLTLTACRAVSPQSTDSQQSPSSGQPTKTIDISIVKSMLSESRIFSFITDLTSIRPYAGWRLSATSGEKEGLEYIEKELRKLPFIASLNPVYEWQSFHVPIALQMWSVNLQVSLQDSIVTIPASGLRGWRSSIADRLLMDSDGKLNDSQPDPVTVTGNVLSIQDKATLNALNAQSGKGKILFVDYQALMTDDFSGNPSYSAVSRLAAADPAAIVIVTGNSNKVGENHGTFANEIGPISKSRLPVIQMRVEDAVSGRIKGWKLINLLTSAEITWDTDLFAPGTSHNLIVRIPGKDPSRSVILSAHIDSVANPGAMDDASGSAILLEVAHVLDESQIQPEMDVYLAWFGSEELGLYGSTHFVNTHQDLLDRTVADLQLDCLTRPLDGVTAKIQLSFWPGNWQQKDASSWVNYMAAFAREQGFEVHKMIFNLESDNSSFDPYDVPNFDVLLNADDGMNGIGGVWYGGHIHDPYDTVETARDSNAQLMQMAQLALQGALLPADTQNFRTSPAAKYRALFIATHTEPPLMTPTGLADFSSVLTDAGFDVDLIPYGKSFSAADLEKADVVFVMPVADFPSQAGDVGQYDETWKASEMQLLQDYVKNGGFLILTNSSQVTGFYGNQLDDNEDWDKMNALGEVFGIKYISPSLDETSAEIVADHPLARSMTRLQFLADEAVAFNHSSGLTLASVGDAVLAAIIPYENGEVLALGDLGMFSAGDYGLLNEQFIKNIADHAARR